MENNNKGFWRSLFSLVIPITIQNFFGTAANSADILMLGYVGQDELSAVSLANQFAFILFGFIFGISSGITMLASQYWGKRDTDSVQAVAGIALRINLVLDVIVALGCVFFPGLLMRIYTNNEVLIGIGEGYLKIVGVSFVLMGISQVYECMLRSCERALASTILSSTALILNVILNGIFIFGLFGCPKMGVTGVAVATLIARIVEISLCAIDAARGVLFKFNIKAWFGYNKLLVSDFIKYALPALINDMMWTLAFSMYSVIMGHMNADIVAASSVATTIRDLCTVLGFALCNGASVMLGVRVGENKLEEARKDATKLCYTALAVSVVTGIVILISKPFVMHYFALSDNAKGYLSIMLYISSYYVIGQIMNTLLIAGIFRVGGNSRWGMICDIIDMWLVSVPLGFLTAFVFKLPPMVVYFILCLDEFWKIPFVYKYYKSEKWLKNITRDFD